MSHCVPIASKDDTLAGKDKFEDDHINTRVRQYPSAQAIGLANSCCMPFVSTAHSENAVSMPPSMYTQYDP